MVAHKGKGYSKSVSQRGEKHRHSNQSPCVPGQMVQSLLLFVVIDVQLLGSI